MNNGLYDPYANTQSPANPYTGFGAQAAPSTPAIPQSYQIKKSDTFASIGSQFNMDEKKLQDMNKMLVTPPKGSFITLARPGFAVGPQTSGGAQQQGSYGAYGSQAQPTNGYPSGALPPGVARAQYGPPKLPDPSNSFYSGVNVNLGELTFNMQNQITNGIAPKAVPTQLLGQLGATPQSMLAAGYVLNPNNKTWELGGSAGNTAPDPNTVKSVYYSKNRGYVTPEVAALLDRRKRKRIEDRPTGPTSFATNAGGTPSNTLDVRVGSG